MVNILEPNKNNFQQCVEMCKNTLINEGLVIFPTETVYGLGADARNHTACKRIFEAKGRPQDNPLIIHLGNFTQIEKYAFVEEVAHIEELKKFWPGPLTVIMNKKETISNVASAGLSTIGIRIPDHSFTTRMLEYTNIPVAAPSANISGRPSATRISHILDELGNKVDLIVDGGNCKYGIESTVILPEDDKCTILRPGAITEDDLKNIFEHVEYAKEGAKVMSPGMKYRHYSPEKSLYYCKSEKIEELYFDDNGKSLFIVTNELYQKLKKNGVGENIILIGNRENPYEISSHLYESFRKLDNSPYRSGYIESFEEKGYYISIMNRLKKAAIQL
ncbi:L-threonylcarbamoyladenylate synthase [Caldiplasma sukawensis]